jgi:hypothetical protein
MSFDIVVVDHLNVVMISLDFVVAVVVVDVVVVVVFVYDDMFKQHLSRRPNLIVFVFQFLTKKLFVGLASTMTSLLTIYDGKTE